MPSQSVDNLMEIEIALEAQKYLDQMIQQRAEESARLQITKEEELKIHQLMNYRYSEQQAFFLKK